MTPALFGLLSPGGREARLSVLIYHRVLAKTDPMFPEVIDAARFDEICGWLGRWFNVLALDDAVDRLGRQALPARALSITFDDGYADNHDVAAPILRRHGLTASFFVSTAFLDGGLMWNDSLIETARRAVGADLDLATLPGLGRYDLRDVGARRQAADALIRAMKYLAPDERQRLAADVASRAKVELPNDLMMTSMQVRHLRNEGMLIGAHTATHPILAKLARADALAEITEGRRSLEGLLGERVGLFAYPNGKPGEDYTDETVALVREAGFDAAVSTHWGVSDASTDRFQLPRFTPWDRTRWRYGARLFGNLRHVR